MIQSFSMPFQNFFPLYWHFAVACGDFLETHNFPANTGMLQKLEFIITNYQQFLNHFHIMTLENGNFHADDVYFLYMLLSNIPPAVIFGNVQFADLMAQILDAFNDYDTLYEG